MKPVLVFNSVVWSDAYDRDDPLWEVGDWFRDGWSGNVHQVDVRHVLDEEYPSLDNYAGLILSGSPNSAYDCDTWIERLGQVALEAIDRELPTLGVCFGHQLIAQVHGGKVELNPKGWEIGDPDIILTDQGRSDPLFEGLPDSFRAIQSHRDIVTKMPAGAVHLASNDLCPIQAYGIGDFVRTVQFHPEMDPKHLNYILGPRRARILETAGIDIQTILPHVGLTPESRMIFRNFEKHFLRG